MKMAKLDHRLSGIRIKSDETTVNIADLIENLDLNIAGGTVAETDSADNLAVTITVTGVANQSHFLHGIHAGFDDGTTLKVLTVKDGATTKENIIVNGTHSDDRSKPLKISEGADLEVSLPASGAAGVVGYVTIRYETR